MSRFTGLFSENLIRQTPGQTAPIQGPGGQTWLPLPAAPPGPTILPPTVSESKRDRKRRETINKIELLHDESWRNRDEKFSALYRDYHNENKQVNRQPPTSAQFALRMYPKSLERDALLESSEIDYQYKVNQAQKDYEAERASIEAQYHEARDQVRQRLLGAIEERRRKLREEKEGGDIVSESLLESAIKPRPKRRMPFKNRIPPPPAVLYDYNAEVPPFEALEPSQVSRLYDTGKSDLVNGTDPSAAGPSGAQTPSNPPRDDLLLHHLLAPSLSKIDISDILPQSSTSLSIIPLPPAQVVGPTTKRGPRGAGAAAAAAAKEAAANAARDASEAMAAMAMPAPGTVTALAIASGQQQPAASARKERNAGASTQWVLGKSLAELKKMESATQLEQESDWARIQGTGARGRRMRGD